MNLQDYYMTAELYDPPMFANREFGIIKDKPTKDNPHPPMWRHLAFKDIDKLRSFLIQHQPQHVYFSSAKYENPGEKFMPLKKEGWLGADLIFDIDDDHLDEPTIVEATYQLLRLKNVLEMRFALKDIFYTYSGSRGYHAHVHDDCIQDLDKYERRDITDYVMMRFHIGIDPAVTPDSTTLIRLPGSIHGKTGKQCRIIDSDKIR